MNQVSIPVITIDGPGGSGKGAVTHRLGKTLGFNILDSGALYRLIGLAAEKAGIALTAEAELVAVASNMKIEFIPIDDHEQPLSVLLESQDVTQAIRSDKAGVDASIVAALPQVREAIHELQYDFRQMPGLIADGRDMGTVVFPTATLKIFLTASAEARAERRYKQLIDKDIGVSLHDLLLSIQERDERDMNRKIAPLKAAEDAITIDSTGLSLDQVFAQVLALARQKLK
ncbi:MAG: (d)CMP kinase [Pseudomonadales bacterium]|nr:(d)CMP kinase [Pseudomonadales bacterium]